MKVSLNSELKISKQPVFKGLEAVKDEYGEKYYECSYPYDSKHYDCYLDIYPVEPDRNGDYEHNTFKKPYTNIFTGENSIKLKPGKNKLYLDTMFGRTENAPFAYHYRFVPKGETGAIPFFQVDAGDLVDKRNFKDDWENVYNIVVPNGIHSGKAGAAILIGADNFDVRYKYDKKGNIVANPDAEKSFDTFKNYANHIGGSLAGVHQALKDGRLDLYSKIFLLPHTSGDRISAAGYWLESGFQFSSVVDNVDTFTKFQNELFAKGKNLVADSALTSEGISGIHAQSIMKYGEDDVFFDWFNCDSLKDMTAKIAAFGVRNDTIRHKLVNPPAFPVQDTRGIISFVSNRAYKKNEPSYVQVYNIDAVSPEQVADSTSLIDSYGKPNGSNPLKYSTHNDIGMTYSFPIEFDVYKENAERMNRLNSARVSAGKSYIPVDSYLGTRLLTKFKKFEFENKIDGGFYTWDANVDMYKFNYTDSTEEIENMMNMLPSKRDAYLRKREQKRNEVLDYAVSSLAYWTRKTNQSLNLYVAQNLKNIDASNVQGTYNRMQKLINDGILPRKINENIDASVVENVLKDDYILKGTKSNEGYSTEILDGLMKYPLESTEVGKDILALFSTPFITNRATKPEYIGVSRLELLKARNPHLVPQYEKVYNITTSMYTGAMGDFANEILSEVNKKLPLDSKFNKGGLTTDYGKYVLPIITQEIAKFAVVKGLFPDVDTEIKKDGGGITYDYDSLRKKSLKSLNIKDSSQEKEAEELIIKLRNGIKKISDSDKKQLEKAILKMIEGTNLKSFQMAEMIVDRTKSGIDWRMDALKDYSNMDSLRNDADTFEDNWERVMKVASAMVKLGIKRENPNAYVVAEVTDEVDLYKMGDGENSERFTWRKAKDKTKHVGDHDEIRWDYRNDLIRKLLRETGIDAVANYSFYFTNIAAIFGKKGDDGKDWGTEHDDRMYNIFVKDDSLEGAEEFLYSGPYDSIVKSYTFVDNHDKPRINHILSLDMEFFFANLNNSFTPKEKEFRTRAFRVLKPDAEVNDDAVQNFDFSNVSSMAVARGEALNVAFAKALDELVNQKDDRGNVLVDPSKKHEMYMALKRVVAQMAAGKYKSINYDANVFGVEEVHKILKLVIDEWAEKNSISSKLKQEMFNKSFEKSLECALSNSLGMDKFLVNSPGIPTIYAGDDLGTTGFDWKTKNGTQKPRSAVHHDWVDKFEFIKKRKDVKDDIYLLRSRPALHALNDGAPFLLKKQQLEGKGSLTALLRYANDGNAVISLFNTAGITHEYGDFTSPDKHPVQIARNRIDLSYDGYEGFIGLHAGLTPGMKFVNANDENDIYEVFKGGDDEYYLAKDKDCSSPIILKDSTLTLYHANQTLMEKENAFMSRVKEARTKKTSFCGRGTYDNPVYNVAPVNYNTNTKEVAVGSKLEVISR